MHQNPEEKQAFSQGEKYLKSGQLDLAEAHFANAIAINETNPVNWARLGQVWIKMNRPAEAKEASIMALQLDPANQEALDNMAHVSIELGDIPIGLAYWEKLFSLNKNIELAEKLAERYSEQSNFIKSASYYNEILKVMPGNYKIQRQLGMSFYKAKDIANAFLVFTDLVIHNPDNRSYIATLVEIYRKLRHEAYSDLFRKALLICLKTDTVNYRSLGMPWCSLVLLDPSLNEWRQFSYERLHRVAHVFKDELLIEGLKKNTHS